MKNINIRKYRIVTDVYCGYEVQIWRIYLPIWMQHRVNTHETLEGAKQYIRLAKKNKTVVYKDYEKDKNN